MFFEQLLNGLTIGSIYGLVGLGFALIYSVLGLVNFAHGDIYMIGAFIGFTAISFLSGNFLLAALAAIAVTGVLGFTVEKLAYKPIRGYSSVTQMVSSLAIGIIIRNLAMVVWGSQTFPFQAQVSGSLRLAIPVIVIVLMISMHFLLTKTKMGIAVRATSMDMQMASCLGVNAEKTIGFVYSIGSCLGGLAGVLVGAYYSAVSFDMGAMMGIKSFIAAIIGGLGSMYGPFIGGIILGVSESFVQAWISPAYKDALAFVILIIILLVKPAGLLGVKVEKGG